MTASWSATITQADYALLHDHLFQPDGEEHAVFMLAGTAYTHAGGRLLIREVIPVPAADFRPGPDGYRLSPRAIVKAARRARESGLTLVWAHSHPLAFDEVDLSSQDHATINAGHPPIIDMTGAAVSAVVLGHHSAAGEVWEPGQPVRCLSYLRVVGPRVVDLAGKTAHTEGTDGRYARQILLFGPAGQERLRSLRVAVLGAGGGGSLIIQQLAHLGVGEIVAVDPDRVALSNLSRIVGSTRLDAILGRRKVSVARRLVRRIDRTVRFQDVAYDCSQAEVAQILTGMDAVFVATDTAISRHTANILAYQYLIPVFQVGAKVQADIDGRVTTVHTAARVALAGQPCLYCQGAIPVEQLRLELLGLAERRAQNYLGGGEDIPDPSVISLNSIPVGVAVTDFLFAFTGLMHDDADLSARVWHPTERRSARRPAKSDPDCSWCGQPSASSSFARGDTWPFPLPRRVESTPRRLGHFLGLARDVSLGWRKAARR